MAPACLFFERVPQTLKFAILTDCNLDIFYPKAPVHLRFIQRLMVSRETQHIGGHHGSHSRVYTWSGTVCIAVDTSNQGGSRALKAGLEPGANNQQGNSDSLHAILIL